MSKHTPGPWRLSDESPRIIKKDFRGIGRDSGCLIASTMGRDDSGFYASNKEADANARLIAAAPDLLEALECMIIGACAVAVPHNGERAVLQEAVNIARAAIAKATGEKNT